MEQRNLGNRGPLISLLGLGTVELGMDYGLPAPGEFGRPSEKDAVAILRRALDLGVTFFDTAPGYGDSERLVGLALGDKPEAIIATKVNVPRTPEGELLSGKRLSEAVEASLTRSLALLGRERLDVVQIHNATEEVLRRGELLESLVRAREKGILRSTGVSVYSETEALMAVDSGSCDVIQVAFSLLDQRQAARTFPAAHDAGVGLILRSVFLKGALTPKAEFLPSHLAGLGTAARAARDALAGGSWPELTSVAIRFALSQPEASGVLVGVRSLEELEAACAVAGTGPLSEREMAIARGLAIGEERLLNPSHWGVA